MIDTLSKLNGTCRDCWDLDPPPDMILTIPPPPMPTFFASSFISVGNRSNAPCPLLCDWTTGQGMEMKEELPHVGNGEENSWFLLTVSSFTFILLLSMCVTLFLLKCRQCTIVYYMPRTESELLQNECRVYEASRRRASQLYEFCSLTSVLGLNQKMKSCLQKTTSTYNDRTYESILYPSLKDNHVLWATLTTKGKPQTVAVTAIPPPPLPPRVSQVRSFENCAFADLDDYSMKYGRPQVSSPVKIENPNIPPINFYPCLKRHNYPSLL